jgi:hypothetical protein
VPYFILFDVDRLKRFSQPFHIMLFANKMSQLFGEKPSTSSDDDLSQQPFLSDESRHIPSRKRKPFVLGGAKRVFLFAWTALIIIVATVIIFRTIRPINNITRETSSVDPEQILECGTSPEEARVHGCVFDVMHYGFTPAPCYNATLSHIHWNELIALGLEFWNDTTKTHLLPYEEILEGKHEFAYTSWLMHLQHCQYVLNRQIQSLVYGLPIDNVLRNVSHAEHCLKEVRSPSDPGRKIWTFFGYLKCASGVGGLGPMVWNPPDGLVHRLQGQDHSSP